MTDTNDPLDQIRQQLGKITPGRWAVAYSRLRVRDNAPVAVERIAMGEIPIASEPATDEWRGHRGHILTFEDRGFVNDIVGEDGAHIVCLGGHEYDDSGAVSVADGEFIAQAPDHLRWAIQEIEQTRLRLDALQKERDEIEVALWRKEDRLQSRLERYDVWRDAYDQVVPVEKPDGEWVRYADVEALLIDPPSLQKKDETKS